MDEKQSFFSKKVLIRMILIVLLFLWSQIFGDIIMTSFYLSWFWLQTYVIVIEEEIVLTPDFLNFLSQCLPALAADDSLFGISAFNYNGKFYRLDVWMHLLKFHDVSSNLQKNMPCVTVGVYQTRDVHVATRRIVSPPPFTCFLKRIIIGVFFFLHVHVMKMSPPLHLFFEKELQSFFLNVHVIKFSFSPPSPALSLLVKFSQEWQK